MALSGSQVTRIGVLGSPGIAYAGFTAKAFTSAEIWSTATTNASTWFVQNPEETTWDAGATFWDLNGNVYITLWDNIDNTWADQASNATTWSDV